MVTHSSGNHAQGVARAARLLGIRAVIVMPETPRRSRSRACAPTAPRSTFVGPADEERVARADELARARRPRAHPVLRRRAHHRRPGHGRPGDRRAAGRGRPRSDDAAHRARAHRRRRPVGGRLRRGQGPAPRCAGSSASSRSWRPMRASRCAQGRIVRWEPELTGRTIADGDAHDRPGPDHVRPPATAARRRPHRDRGRHQLGHARGRDGRPASSSNRPARLALAAWLRHRAELPAAATIVIVVSGGNVDPDATGAAGDRRGGGRA